MAPATPQYWDGAQWTNITAAALEGTYEGGAFLEWPKPEGTGSNGGQAGALGNPTFVLRMAIMTDTGMDFWRDLFAASTDEYVTFDFKGWDLRTETDAAYSGKLRWPTFEGVSLASTVAATRYRGVEVRVEDCVASVH